MNERRVIFVTEGTDGDAIMSLNDAIRFLDRAAEALDVNRSTSELFVVRITDTSIEIATARKLSEG